MFHGIRAHNEVLALHASLVVARTEDSTRNPAQTVLSTLVVNTMTIDMCIKNKFTGDCEFTKLCSWPIYKSFLLPLALAENLELLKDITVTSVPPSYRDQMLDELKILVENAQAHNADGRLESLISDAKNVMQIMREVDMTASEVSFG
jgi:hypothetical protein